MAETKVYQHSGAVGSGSWSIPVVAFPFALLASVAYGYASAYMPCVGYFSVLLPIAFGFLIAWVTGRAAKASRCRNATCAMLMGFLSGVLGLYGGWVVFLYAVDERFGFGWTQMSLLQLFASPSEVLDRMTQLNAAGWFTIKGSTPTGVVLWICWALEALIIVGFATLLPPRILSDWVYCENCDKWCKEKDDLARFGDTANSAQKTRLQKGDLTVLAELRPYSGGKIPHIRLNNRRCDTCGTTETVQIKRYWYEASGKNTNEKSEDLTKHILLDAGALDALQSAMVAQAERKANPLPSAKPPAKP